MVKSTWGNVLPSLGSAPELQSTGTPNPVSSPICSRVGQNCGLGEPSLDVSGAPRRAVVPEQLLTPLPACAAGLIGCVGISYRVRSGWFGGCMESDGLSHGSNVRESPWHADTLKPWTVFMPGYPKYEAGSVFLQTSLWPGWWCPPGMSRCDDRQWATWPWTWASCSSCCAWVWALPSLA